MLKPLLLVLGAVAFVGALMLGGWALTGGGADLPASQAPAAGFTTADPSGAEEPAGTQPQPAGEVPQPREQQDALGEDTSAGELSRRARERLSRSGTAAPAPVRRTARPPATSPVPADDAAEPQRADDAARRRAEQQAQAELARRAAARRAEEAKQAADRARNHTEGDDFDDD